MKLSHSWLKQLPIQNIVSCETAHGGDMNLAFQIKTKDKNYFMKVQPKHTKDFYAHEIRGIKQMAMAGVNTLTPIANGQIDGDAYLLLNWLTPDIGNQADLGREVAKLHLKHNSMFGFGDTYSNRVMTKDNHWNKSWSDFYLNQRLLPEVAYAKKHYLWNDSRELHFQRMVNQFEDYYSKHIVLPSLCHGDLWFGNVMFSKGQPYLIDPDAVYADREFDLAMTTVFGGFNQNFYRAYDEVCPLNPGIEKRLNWYKFYYLCMHLDLFGESYGPEVDSILANF